MKTHILGLLVGASAIAMSFVACSQPPIDCRVAHSGATGYNYAAVFTPTSGNGTCAAFVGDQIGMETYHDVAKNGDTEKQDFTKPAKVAIQTMHLGFLAQYREGFGFEVDSSEAHKQYSYGAFDAVEPNDKDICTIKSLKPAEQELPPTEAIACPDLYSTDDCGTCTADSDCFLTYTEVCDTTAGVCNVPAYPQQNIKYEWSNVNVYVTAASGGAQFQAHVKYTENDCTAEYDVTGVWPFVNCTGQDADGNFVPDDTLCCPEGDITRDRPNGSGISPDFPVKCVDLGGIDRDLSDAIGVNIPNFACVLDMSYSKDGKIPVVKEDWAKDAKKAPACQPLKTGASSETGG